jgi:hypothetical protein
LATIEPGVSVKRPMPADRDHAVRFQQEQAEQDLLPGGRDRYHRTVHDDLERPQQTKLHVPSPIGPAAPDTHPN